MPHPLVASKIINSNFNYLLKNMSPLLWGIGATGVILYMLILINSIFEGIRWTHSIFTGIFTGLFLWQLPAADIPIYMEEMKKDSDQRILHLAEESAKFDQEIYDHNYDFITAFFRKHGNADLAIGHSHPTNYGDMMRFQAHQLFYPGDQNNMSSTIHARAQGKVDRLKKAAQRDLDDARRRITTYSWSAWAMFVNWLVRDSWVQDEFYEMRKEAQRKLIVGVIDAPGQQPVLRLNK